MTGGLGRVAGLKFPLHPFKCCLFASSEGRRDCAVDRNKVALRSGSPAWNRGSTPDTGRVCWAQGRGVCVNAVLCWSNLGSRAFQCTLRLHMTQVQPCAWVPPCPPGGLCGCHLLYLLRLWSLPTFPAQTVAFCGALPGVPPGAVFCLCFRKMMGKIGQKHSALQRMEEKEMQCFHEFIFLCFSSKRKLYEAMSSAQH